MGNQNARRRELAGLVAGLFPPRWEGNPPPEQARVAGQGGLLAPPDPPLPDLISAQRHAHALRGPRLSGADPLPLTFPRPSLNSLDPHEAIPAAGGARGQPVTIPRFWDAPVIVLTPPVEDTMSSDEHVLLVSQPPDEDYFAAPRQQRRGSSPDVSRCDSVQPEIDLAAVSDPAALLALLSKTSLFLPAARDPILHRLAAAVVALKRRGARTGRSGPYTDAMRRLWDARRMSKFRRSEWDALMAEIDREGPDAGEVHAGDADAGGDEDATELDPSAAGDGASDGGSEARSAGGLSASTDETRAMGVSAPDHTGEGRATLAPNMAVGLRPPPRGGHLSLGDWASKRALSGPQSERLGAGTVDNGALVWLWRTNSEDSLGDI